MSPKGVVGASMGPWLRSHGRPEATYPIRALEGMLQWGRGFAATEGTLCPVYAPRANALQWGRGFAATEGDELPTVLLSAVNASMGPWLRSHGRAPKILTHPANLDGFNGAVASQPRKEPENCCSGVVRVALQWGRGFAATEGVERMQFKSSDD